VRQLSSPLRALSRQRRRRFAPLAMLLVALAATGGAYAAFAPSPQAAAATGTSAATIEDGRQLFLKNCSSCHGLNAQGSSDGPSLIGVGAAAVDFQVGTGRMPATQVNAQVEQKPQQFTDEEISALAAYIASLAPGPPIPSDEDVDYLDADAARGGQIYRTNCSMCHNFAGSGGALSRGKFAPSLRGVSPKHIYEAMLTGPQSMPVFPDTTMTPQDKRDIIAYLKATETEVAAGGWSLGKIGPVTEGLAGWILGLGGLIACAVWLGAKAR
jgi:ubiquinol-cytochrome c reductase cytochrome c subunit